MIRIAIVVGSTRPGPKAESVARWVYDIACTRDDATFEVVDLADYDLPHLDEPVPAAMGPNYSQQHSRRWAATIASFDGYVIVTPEYNHSTSGVLKNAIDFLYAEWNSKAAGFVSYGSAGGARAVEHLRLVMAELKVATVRSQVMLGLATDFVNYSDFLPLPHQEAALDTVLDQLIDWSKAMEPLRAA